MKTVEIDWLKLSGLYVVGWIWILFAFEVLDSISWMTRTGTMLVDHPMLGTFVGYGEMESAGDSTQRLPIIMGKWIGMCKGFWAGSLLAVALFGNNLIRTFVHGWNAVGLTIMSIGLYPTLDQLALLYPGDFSYGFSNMRTLEAIFAALSVFGLILGLIIATRRTK